MLYILCAVLDRPDNNIGLKALASLDVVLGKIYHCFFESVVYIFVYIYSLDTHANLS